MTDSRRNSPRASVSQRRGSLRLPYGGEVAGVRHVHGTDISAIYEGDPISFEVDAQNPVDRDALAVMHNGRPIGYVNRALRSTFSNWLRGHHVSANVERQNGKPDRPLIFVRVSVE